MSEDYYSPLDPAKFSTEKLSDLVYLYKKVGNIVEEDRYADWGVEWNDLYTRDHIKLIYRLLKKEYKSLLSFQQ